MPIEVKLSADVVDVAKREVTFYGSAFGNRDVQGQRVLPNAFGKTIREQLPRGEVKHFRNHTVSIGPMRELVQDSYGLLCTGYCSKTRAGDEYLEQALDGSLTHASIYGRIVRERAEWVTEKDAATGQDIETLNIGEIILYEAGLVDLRPANNLATLVAVKGLGDDGFLDTLLELDYVVKSFALSRNGGRPTAEERRVAKALLSLRAVLEDQEEALKSLLAPGDITQTPESAPSLATPAELQPDLTALLESLRQRGQIHL
jgi:phage head maturation protease